MGPRRSDFAMFDIAALNQAAGSASAIILGQRMEKDVIHVSRGSSNQALRQQLGGQVKGNGLI